MRRLSFLRHLRNGWYMSGPNNITVCILFRLHIKAAKNRVSLVKLVCSFRKHFKPVKPSTHRDRHGAPTVDHRSYDAALVSMYGSFRQFRFT
ncbi:hypothetical protein RvY_03876-2 [Ramazzottius varieornatus]|uniref:Uncharacterized protein n=1 Tax=Ramazzottius varieornatus TaxID=947166 RepID=A0A1D1UYY4_RAMVA|nr:hypothetical protein RvY_03876-2 [Ramazzottius varieornatus]